MRSSRSSMRSSLRRSTKLGVLKHTSSLPLWTSTIIWVPPQHGGSPPFDMGILDEERANHQNTDPHETSLNPDASTRNRRSGGRHLIAKGLEESKAVYRDRRDFLKQRQENPIHICSKINDPKVSERLSPLPRPRPTANIGKEQQVAEEHEGTWDFQIFRQTRPRSQYDESKKKPHTLAQTFLLLRGDEDLRKKIPMVHDSTQDPLVLQLLEEVNKLKAKRQAEISDWNQLRSGPLTRRILDTLFQAKTKQKLGLQLYTGREDPIEHLNLFESTMAYRMHTNEERCLLFPSILISGALNWYCRLPPEIVDSFEELRKLFVSQHIFQTDRLHSTDDLYTIRQKPDESHESMPVASAMSILVALRQMTRLSSRTLQQAYVIVSSST
ncbi:hypothetical protein TB2_009045 [Malus domestica]